MPTKKAPTPQRPKSRKSAPAKSESKKRAERRKYDPSHARKAPELGVIPSDNPTQGRQPDLSDTERVKLEKAANAARKVPDAVIPSDNPAQGQTY